MEVVTARSSSRRQVEHRVEHIERTNIGGIGIEDHLRMSNRLKHTITTVYVVYVLSSILLLYRLHADLLSGLVFEKWLSLPKSIYRKIGPLMASPFTAAPTVYPTLLIAYVALHLGQWIVELHHQ